MSVSSSSVMTCPSCGDENPDGALFCGGCGASLAALRRTAVGPFRLADAVTLEHLEREPDAVRGALLPPEALVAGLPRLEAGETQAARFLHGQPIACGEAPEGAELALFGPGKRFLGVGLGQAGGTVAPLRLVAGGNEAGCP